MPSYPVRALVLRKTKLGETDLIVTLLASDGSQVRAVAKGARKPRSRFGARVEPYSVVDLLLHTGRSLEVIAEAETVSAHGGLRADLDRATAAAVVADVLDKISLEGQVEPKLFDMASVTLDVLEAAPVAALRALVAAFLLKALAMQGYRPALDACASCGRAAEGPGAVAFSMEAGGCLCDACAGRDPSARPLTTAARAHARALVRARMAEVPGLAGDEDAVEETLRFAVAYTAYHVPARLKALDQYMRGL
jgi:DNA repair protein RecO (recombination protein O)